METSDKDEGEKNIPKIQTFTVPIDLVETKEYITVSTNTPSKPSKEQIINEAFKFHSQGNTPEAAKYYQYFINQGFEDHRVFSNYGNILKDLGKLQDAELSTRKAIELKPDFAEAHYNLAVLLRDLGKKNESNQYCKKAIDLKPWHIPTAWEINS